MKAIQFASPRDVRIVDVPEPVMGPEDVLIEVRYIGLCGSDLNTYRGLMPLVQYPRIPGHEISGVIVDAGDKAAAYIHLGDEVTVSPYTACGVCPACRAGRPNCCQHNQTLGVQRDGALQSHIAVPYSKIYTHPGLSSQELALVEPLSVGYHAANRGRISEIDTVLVMGAGTVGVGVIAAAVRKGATVIALDVDDNKLIQARKFGASHTINSQRQDPMAAITALTHGEGVSVAVEAVGLPQTYRLAIEAVSYAGRVVYVGYAKREVSYDATDFVRKELDILGSRNALRVFPAVMKMLAQRAHPFIDLISAIYPFEQTADALRDWDAQPGAYSKILIDLKRSSPS